MPERVAVFIDGSNLYHSLKQRFGKASIDFQEFCARLVGERALFRIYYYNAPLDQTKEPERYRDQQRFFASLRSVPYLELRRGRLVYRNWPNEAPYEKGIDVKLATDMLVHGFRANYDTVVLVSGDDDFSDALQAVKDVGKHVEIALFGQRTSQHLREVADAVIEMGPDFLSGCWR